MKPDGVASARPLILTLAIGFILVTLCYYFVDKPVAWFVYDHQLSNYALLKWLTLPPPIIQAWSPLVLLALILRWSKGRPHHWELVLAAMCVSMILADQFRESLSYLFGRYWPETWVDHNPSLIHDDAYGFHPFNSGRAFGSFPSGHAARMSAPAAVLWLSYPRWGWVGGVVLLLTAIGLLGMNYHFVGDIIAGSIVGGLVGYYTFKCMQAIARPSQPVSPTQVV